MLVNTSTLTGPALDWAVAKCEGGYDLRLITTYGTKTAWQYTLADDEDPERKDRVYLGDYEPSTDWSQGGPIIEQECLSPEPLLDENCILVEWACRNWRGDGQYYSGATALEAAMRAFVASKLGDTVEIPDELVVTQPVVTLNRDAVWPFR